MSGRSKGVLSAAVVIATGLSFFASAIVAHGAESIELPPPQTTGGKPLMEALSARRSSRNFSDKELPLQVLSDLLWAAAGVNRRTTGGRTAPTSRGLNEIDVYVALADGLFLYEPLRHVLIPILGEDIRIFTGTQPFVKNAPVNLIYTADHAKMRGMTGDEKEFYAATDTGFVSENVYLFCASEGLATVVRGSVAKLTLKKQMRLRDSQVITLVQTVGYPA